MTNNLGEYRVQGIYLRAHDHEIKCDGSCGEYPDDSTSNLNDSEILKHEVRQMRARELSWYRENKDLNENGKDNLCFKDHYYQLISNLTGFGANNSYIAFRVVGELESSTLKQKAEAIFDAVYQSSGGRYTEIVGQADSDTEVRFDCGIEYRKIVLGLEFPGIDINACIGLLANQPVSRKNDAICNIFYIQSDPHDKYVMLCANTGDFDSFSLGRLAELLFVSLGGDDDYHSEAITKGIEDTNGYFHCVSQYAKSDEAEQQRKNYLSKGASSGANAFVTPDSNMHFNTVHLDAEYRLTLPSVLFEAYESLCQEQDVEASTGLCALFSMLLARFANEDAALISILDPNRHFENNRYALGPLATEVLIGVDVHHGEGVVFFLQRFKNTLLQTLDQQIVPTAELFDCSLSGRDSLHSPAPLTLSFSDIRRSRSIDICSGLEITRLQSGDRPFYAQMHTKVEIDEAGCHVTYIYNSTRYNPSIVESFAAAVEPAISAILQNPLVSIGSVPLIDEIAAHYDDEQEPGGLKGNELTASRDFDRALPENGITRGQVAGYARLLLNEYELERQVSSVWAVKTNDFTRLAACILLAMKQARSLIWLPDTDVSLKTCDWLIAHDVTHIFCDEAIVTDIDHAELLHTIVFPTIEIRSVGDSPDLVRLLGDHCHDNGIVMPVVGQHLGNARKLPFAELLSQADGFLGTGIINRESVTVHLGEADSLKLLAIMLLIKNAIPVVDVSITDDLTLIVRELSLAGSNIVMGAAEVSRQWSQSPVLPIIESSACVLMEADVDSIDKAYSFASLPGGSPAFVAVKGKNDGRLHAILPLREKGHAQGLYGLPIYPRDFSIQQSSSSTLPLGCWGVFVNKHLLHPEGELISPALPSNAPECRKLSVDTLQVKPGNKTVTIINGQPVSLSYLTDGLNEVLHKGTEPILHKAALDHGVCGIGVDLSPIPVSGIPRLRFSLFYFGAETYDPEEKYNLYLTSARYADQHGFEALWTPERHFGVVGALYPTPSLLNAALATVTRNIHLRSGSVVLPLQHPIRIAEEWSVVDNLSNGRVGMGVASGFHPRDFVIAPDKFEGRRDCVDDYLDSIRSLWRGERVVQKDGESNDCEIEIYPKPVQSELPIWLTTAGNPQAFKEAGRKGLNILTHMLGQPVENLANKIKIYRSARAEAGLNPAGGKVTVMIHTFLGEDFQKTLDKARAPFSAYIQQHANLILRLINKPDAPSEDVDDATLAGMADFAFDFYVKKGALIGTPESVQPVVEELIQADVDEVACLVDWMDNRSVMDGLASLNNLKNIVNGNTADRNQMKRDVADWAGQLSAPVVIKVDEESYQYESVVQYAVDESSQMSGTKKFLRELWETYIDADIKSESNFFSIGGTYTDAVHMLNKVRQLMNVSVTLNTLLEDPSLHQLSCHIDALKLNIHNSTIESEESLEEGIL